MLVVPDLEQTTVKFEGEMGYLTSCLHTSNKEIGIPVNKTSDVECNLLQAGPSLISVLVIKKLCDKGVSIGRTPTAVRYDQLLDVTRQMSEDNGRVPAARFVVDHNQSSKTGKGIFSGYTIFWSFCDLSKTCSFKDQRFKQRGSPIPKPTVNALVTNSQCRKVGSSNASWCCCYKHVRPMMLSVQRKSGQVMD